MTTNEQNTTGPRHTDHLSEGGIDMLVREMVEHEPTDGANYRRVIGGQIEKRTDLEPSVGVVVSLQRAAAAAKGWVGVTVVCERCRAQPDSPLCRDRRRTRHRPDA